jgi:hypothetical protein
VSGRRDRRIAQVVATRSGASQVIDCNPLPLKSAAASERTSAVPITPLITGGSSATHTVLANTIPASRGRRQ